MRSKYRAIRELRQSDDPSPQPRMRALAARFPGALRELDELPLETVDARIRSLDAAIDGAAPPPRWAETLCRYHGWMRVALQLKREVGPARDPAAAASWIEGHAPAPDEPTRDALRARLDAILRPPGGRLSRLVLAWIADELGHAAADLAEEAFPASPMRSDR